MKIIHITTSLNSGGLENIMVDIANEQNRLGHQVAIIVVNKGVEPTISSRIDKNIQIFFIGRKPGSWRIVPIIKLWLIFRKLSNYDIIHAHGIYLGKVLRCLTKTKIILTIHGVNKDIKPLRYYNKLFAISGAVRTDIENRSDFKPLVVYNGIETKSIKTKQQLFEDGNFKIIQVSRLVHEIKGQDILLRAIKHCIENEGFNSPRITLDFVGDGQSRGILERLTKELGISHRVRFLGNKSRNWVYENLCCYDLFVQPSRYEGFGITVAEAMAAKVPVIVANRDGPAEILDFGKYGWLFENENICDLALKIEEVKILSQNDELSDLLESAYKHCIKNYDIQITVKNYIKQYNIV